MFKIDHHEYKFLDAEGTDLAELFVRLGTEPTAPTVSLGVVNSIEHRDFNSAIADAKNRAHDRLLALFEQNADTLIASHYEKMSPDAIIADVLRNALRHLLPRLTEGQRGLFDRIFTDPIAKLGVKDLKRALDLTQRTLRKNEDHAEKTAAA